MTGQAAHTGNARHVPPLTAEDFRFLAGGRLPRALSDYIDGGADAELTLEANTADFTALTVRQRVLRDVASATPAIRLLDEEWAFPLGLSPVGMAGMMRRRGEVQALRAAGAAGIPFCLSTISICSIEEVAEQAARPFWFQLNMMKDRGVVAELLDRASSAGCRTLAFTVDLPVVGHRRKDARNGADARRLLSRLRYLTHMRWAWDVGLRGRPHVFGNLARYVPGAGDPTQFKAWVDAQFDAGLTWKDAEWLRQRWKGALVIKGVLDPEDAAMAVKTGFDAILVSNHGGRQLDSTSSTISMTPRIAEAVEGRVPLLIDGGVRGGQDIVKAVALGASAAMIGRPWVWALAADGERGVSALLRMLRAEFETSMRLCGFTSPSQISAAALDGGAP